MSDIRLGNAEGIFADIIWKYEPISSGELVKKAESVLGWKKSTTYTMLKRLCQKGIFQNEGGTVTSLISKDEFFQLQSEQFVKNTFNGSLPAFLTAFTKRNKLTEDEISELEKLIEKLRK